MSRHIGSYYKGASQETRRQKREQAEERQAVSAHEKVGRRLREGKVCKENLPGLQHQRANRSARTVLRPTTVR